MDRIVRTFHGVIDEDDSFYEENSEWSSQEIQQAWKDLI
jgi:hypothetical protein